MRSPLFRLAVTAALTLFLGVGLLPAQADDEAPPVAPAVTVSGIATIGSTLTATATGFDGPVSYAWFDDDRDPTNVTTSTYTITAADPQRAFVVRATGLVGDATQTVESTQTLHVMGYSVPKIFTDSYSVGSVLRAGTGSWSDGTDFAYQWYASGRRIAGATGPTFRLTTRQGDRQISVHVQGSQEDYQGVNVGSARTGRILSPTPKPGITGTSAVGRVVAAKPGRWERGTRLAYQWYASGRPISGAHGSRYRISSANAGKRLQVKVRGTRRGYETVARMSGSTALVQRIGRTTLSGSSKVGQRVRLHSRGWVRGTSLSYAWYLDGRRISGANGTSVGVRSEWVGKRLSAHVTGRKSGYRTFTSTSGRTRPIAKPTPPPSSGGGGGGAVAPVSKYSCPSYAPIKGNQSGIYHVPGGRYYDQTTPEACFRTAADAVAAGYRASRNG